MKTIKFRIKSERKRVAKILFLDPITYLIPSILLNLILLCWVGIYI